MSEISFEAVFAVVKIHRACEREKDRLIDENSTCVDHSTSVYTSYITAQRYTEYTRIGTEIRLDFCVVKISTCYNGFADF